MQLNNSFDVEGEVVEIGQPTTYGKVNQHQKRVLAVSMYVARYKAEIPFEFHDDATSYLDDLSIGDHVLINFRISGNKWEKDGQTKRFSNLEGRSVQKLT